MSCFSRKAIIKKSRFSSFEWLQQLPLSSSGENSPKNNPFLFFSKKYISLRKTVLKECLIFLQPGQDDDSDSTCEEMHRQRNKRTSPKEPAAAAPGATSSVVQYKEDDENLWMTSTQFSQLLDKQEALENLGYAKLHKQKSLSIVTNNPVNASSSKSYLDSEALLPLAKMKQVRFRLNDNSVGCMQLEIQKLEYST